MFQFTHPGGVRPVTGVIDLTKSISFNSRTREGCDLVEMLSDVDTMSFNSRTREGCDKADE